MKTFMKWVDHVAAGATVTLLMVFVYVGAAALLHGCTAAQWGTVQKDATVTHTVTTPGTPTTQPAIATGQVVVQAASAANPNIALIVQGISILSAMVAAYAGGKVSGNATTSANTKAALTEVATAATGFLPGEWSTVATDALKAAGLHTVADPNTNIVPAVVVTKPAT